jgi:hypothetical protein
LWKQVVVLKVHKAQQALRVPLVPKGHKVYRVLLDPLVLRELRVLLVLKALLVRRVFKGQMDLMVHKEL